MAVVVEVLDQATQVVATDISGVVLEVLAGTTTPIETVKNVAVVDTVSPGGTVANVGWGYDFPSNPIEGQIFIKVTPP